MSLTRMRKGKSKDHSLESEPAPPLQSVPSSGRTYSSKSWAVSLPEVFGELGIEEIAIDEILNGSGGTENLSLFQNYSAEEQDLEAEDNDFEYQEKTQALEKLLYVPEVRRKTLIVHSTPSLFPDIHKARRSVFGSTFLRAPTNTLEESALLKTIAGSNYSMLHSLLSSFDKILNTASSEVDQRRVVLAYKESLIRALENHGITRTYSDGSIHWDIYPITQSSLFSIQVGDHVHQTRNLSRIEDRITTGPVQSLKTPHEWPTESSWTGHWDELGMAGAGDYIMPHGVLYNGKMKDGVFHDDDATLTYPNKFKAIHCVYNNGNLLNCQFQFPDSLNHEMDNWEYCKFPDRIFVYRFWSEVRNGLKPAKIAQKTEVDPPRRIPTDCFDTNDGFYNPKALTLLSPAGELLRVPVCEEDIWIKRFCRKGFFQPTNFRPDLFENWFEHDLIDAILIQQNNYRNGRITYDELQQFYADQNLLPSWSKYQRKKTPSEIAREEFLKSITEPKPLKLPKVVKKFVGHKLPSEVLGTLNEVYRMPAGFQEKKTKSLNKIRRASKAATPSQVAINVRSSRISFKLGSEASTSESQDLENSSTSLEPKTDSKRKISGKYLVSQPLLRPPFFRGRGVKHLSDENLGAADSSQKEKCREKGRRSASRMNKSSSTAMKKFSSNTDLEKDLFDYMKKLVLEAMEVGLVEEANRHRQRLIYGRKVPPKAQQREGPNDKCLNLLRELFDSIPDKDEGCDSDPTRMCDLRALAEDKYSTLKYWGKRMFMLEFDEDE